MFVWWFWSRAAKDGARSEPSQSVAGGELTRSAADEATASSSGKVGCNGAEIRRPRQDNSAALSATYVYVDNFR